MGERAGKVGRGGRSRRAGRGVTLVELVLAMALTTIIIGGATAVMVVASRALPRESDMVVVATDAATGLSLLESELQCATVTDLGVRSVRFQVPDRDADAVAEEITYAWSGTAGDPLTRTEDGVRIEVVAGVQAASVTWTMARGSATRVGSVYITLTLRSGLMVYSTTRLLAEPEDSL